MANNFDLLTLRGQLNLRILLGLLFLVETLWLALATGQSVFFEKLKGCRLVLELSLAIMNQVLHLLVLHHDEILNLLCELLKSIYEVSWLVAICNLLKFRQSLLAIAREDAVFERRIQREHALLLLIILTFVCSITC